MVHLKVNFIISFERSSRLWLISFFRFVGFFIFWSTSRFCMCFNFRIEQIIDFNFALNSLFRLRKMFSGDDWCPKLKSYEIKNFLNYFLQKFLYNFWVLINFNGRGLASDKAFTKRSRKFEIRQPNAKTYGPKPCGPSLFIICLMKL